MPVFAGVLGSQATMKVIRMLLLVTMAMLLSLAVAQQESYEVEEFEAFKAPADDHAAHPADATHPKNSTTHANGTKNGTAAGCKPEKKVSSTANKPVPHRKPPTVQEKLLFGLMVVGTVGVASVTTYFKTRNGESRRGGALGRPGGACMPRNQRDSVVLLEDTGTEARSVA